MEGKPYGKTLLITLGDPEGIGPEIIRKALSSVQVTSGVVIVGNRAWYDDPAINNTDDLLLSGKRGVSFLEVETGGNDPSFMYVKKAVSLAMKGLAGAVVTAPVSKEKWKAAGNQYMGHTDFLVRHSGAAQWAMFFWSAFIKVALFTTHIPLSEVFQHITKDNLIRFCRFVDSELFRLTGKRFDLLMSGLNPHSGESGLIGAEETDEIIPAVTALRDEMRIEGPFPPDTVFLEAEKRENPVVISLYHDQGLIPFKLNNINSGVNLTLGLPFIRTSPDHGTAFDIAGRSMADPGSMIEAVRLADQLLQTGR